MLIYEMSIEIIMSFRGSYGPIGEHEHIYIEYSCS